MIFINKILYQFCNNQQKLRYGIFLFFIFQKNEIKRINIKQDYLYGLNPTQIALNANKRKIVELSLNESVKQNLPPKIANIINIAQQKEIPINYMKRDKLDKLVKHQPHQNVIIKCEPLKYIRINSSDIFQGKIIVFLDQITDPQNFGAILRTCFYLGVDNVVVEESKRCPLNSTVSKTSSGAMELMDIFCTSNSVEFIKECQKLKWKVFACGVNFGQNNKQISLDKLKLNIVIILGSEGSGVNKELSNQADKILYINQSIYFEKPIVFPNTLVDSLNVNSAASIIIENIKRQMF
ncbi:rRNA methyltransferase 1, putative [Ichthyophthirius multifiliis]|uniref:rRNA methyltransferase 1, mitochondrial n=1 Tax=Ichthyophthirius multifiliis TaxID=5932 RepID=G0QNB7_ICHMU|nr:rRNA methyltransferase 1, putative [Ichthyophthirius multifiliis]EGR33282.1 rRNA methyltransferase 1, putative [Ichthyophthirius multifiliis]|eukprot:XP_004037268.1 rRNA methyltransferase 1, putative [Ichthyophthirius multifiliis]